MAFVVWNDRLSVGIESMDQEHKVLVDLLNQLFEAIKAGNADRLFAELHTKLVEYTIRHFESEEKLMQEYGFPEFDSHHQLHSKLAADVSKIDRQTFCDNTKEILQFLKMWLLDHIMLSDKEYGKYITTTVGTS